MIRPRFLSYKVLRFRSKMRNGVSRAVSRGALDSRGRARRSLAACSARTRTRLHALLIAGLMKAKPVRQPTRPHERLVRVGFLWTAGACDVNQEAVKLFGAPHFQAWRSSGQPASGPRLMGCSESLARLASRRRPPAVVMIRFIRAKNAE